MANVGSVSRIFVIIINLIFTVSSEEASVILSVSSRPATENNDVTFTCVTSSSISPSFIIWKNGSTLGFLNNTCGELETGTFAINKDLYSYRCLNETEYSWTIKTASRYMNGESWTCYMVISGIQTASNTVTLNVHAPILRVTMPLPIADTVDILEHSSKLFQCVSSGGIPEGQVRWYLGNVTAGLSTDDIEFTQNITSVKQTFDHGIVAERSDLMLFSDRTMLHMHVYCSAHNGVGQIQISDRKPKLNVLYSTDGPPSIVDKTEQPFLLIEGIPDMFSCILTGGNPLPEVAWNCPNATVAENNNTTGSTVIATMTVTVSRGQAIQCSCVANQNISGLQTDALDIEVLYPPDPPNLHMESTNITDSVRLFENTSVIIVCSASGNPAPAVPSGYVWTQPGGLSVDGDNLTLTTLDREVSGIYTCTVSNNMTSSSNVTIVGTNFSQILVLVQYPPSKPIFLYQNATGPEVSSNGFNVIRGDNFSLVCISDSEPEPVYLWSDGSSSRILDVMSVDRDIWVTCKATNTMEDFHGTVINGSAVSENITVNVYYPPDEPSVTVRVNGTLLEGSLDNLKIIIGTEDINATCNATSRPDAHCEWTDHNDVLWNASTLHIPRLTVDHGGQYTCKAFNNMTRTFEESVIGTNHAAMILDVLYPPRVQPMSTQTVTEGHEFNFRCPVVLGNPNVTNFRWSRRHDKSTWDTQTINITVVNRMDSGLYTCTVNVTLKPTSPMTSMTFSNSEEFYLDVQYAASINSFNILNYEDSVSIQSTVTVNEFDHLSLKCDVTANPKATIAIIRDDTDLVRVNEALHLGHVNSNMTCFDAGTYTCVGYNVLNNVSDVTALPSVEVRVFVRCQPRPYPGVPLNSKLTAAIGQTVTFTFTTLAYPLPSHGLFRWYRINGSEWLELTDSRFQVTMAGKITILTIERLEMMDYGSYGLTVSNGVGQIYVQLFYVSEPQVSGEESEDSSLVLPIVAGATGAMCAIVVLAVTHICRRRRIRCGRRGQSVGDDNRTSGQYLHIGQPRPTTSGNDYEAVTSGGSKRNESIYQLQGESNPGCLYDELDHNLDDPGVNSTDTCNAYESLRGIHKIGIPAIPKRKVQKRPENTAVTIFSDMPPLPMKVCERRKGKKTGALDNGVVMKLNDICKTGASKAGVYMDMNHTTRPTEEMKDKVVYEEMTATSAKVKTRGPTL